MVREKSVAETDLTGLTGDKETNMRPDQHPDLVSMGVGKITCDKCMLNLFQGEPDETCEDCKLNILIHGTPSEKQAHIRALVDEINSADTQAVIKSYIDLIPTKQQRS